MVASLRYCCRKWYHIFPFYIYSYPSSSFSLVPYFCKAEESWKLESSAKAGGNEEAEVSLDF